LTAHLGYEAGKDAPPFQPNRRNGTAGKRLKGQDGEMPISVPRDRDGSFEPELVKKGQTRIDGIDDKIIHCPAGDCEAISREGGSTPTG
jgi:transposase-like protein